MMKKHNVPKTAKSWRPLTTEYPLSEKDEQANCMESMRKLQSEALKLWRTFKKRRK